MSDMIRAKFEQLHPYKEGSNKSLYESLYAIFKEGWENGKAESENPLNGVTERRYGFCIPVVEYERGWGAKHDGYMVGFTIEDLKARQESFENSNSGDYGLYYARPNEFTPVELTMEAIEALMIATDRHCTIWFDSAEQFIKGVENE